MGPDLDSDHYLTNHQGDVECARCAFGDMRWARQVLATLVACLLMRLEQRHTEVCRQVFPHVIVGRFLCRAEERG